MKRTIFISFMLTVLFSACSLEENPQGYVTRESFYKTEIQCWSALRSLYTPLHHIYTKEFMIATEGATDLWYLNSSKYYDATLSLTPVTCGVATEVWKYAYKGIARANECIEYISKSPVKASLRGPMVAEARAMRALYYYLLTSFMGDVPFYIESVSDLDALDYIRTLERKPASEIREFLCKDLIDNALPHFTEENGFRCRTNEISNQHAGYALTQMLIAKMAMWEQKWDVAITAIEGLEDVYKVFDEKNFPLEHIKWSEKMTDETIFEIQHEWKVNGTKFYGEIAPVMTPKCSGNGIYDGVYMPGLAQTGTTATPMRANTHFALFKSSKNGLNAKEDSIFPAIDRDAINNGQIPDRRIFLMFGIGDIETGNDQTSLESSKVFQNVNKTGNLYGGPKFWCYDMTGTYDSNNYRIFRYADALLMKAECLYMKNGDADGAAHYINMVRKRAYTDPQTLVLSSSYSDYTPDGDVMKMICYERARELGGEFHRKFDLVRWGIWLRETRAFNESPKGLADNARAYHEFYPIPETECALSGGVLSNDKYMTDNE